jgi:hypothetical protein
MGQKRRQPDLARVLIDGRGLDRGDLVLAEALADDIKPAGQRGIAKGPLALVGNQRADDSGEGFFGIGQLSLGLRKGGGNGPDGLTAALHGRPPSPSHQS